MATNPLIPLMAEVPKTDLFDSFLQGVDYKDSREDRARAKELQPMQDRLLKLQTDAAEQNLETTGIANEAAISQQQLQQALQGYDHATNLLQIQDTMERARVHQAVPSPEAQQVAVWLTANIQRRAGQSVSGYFAERS